MVQDRQHSNLQVNSIEYLNHEINTIKSSMSGMMEIIVGEIDSIKRELYLDFGQNQKILFEDISSLKNREDFYEEKWKNFELQVEKTEK